SRATTVTLGTTRSRNTRAPVRRRSTMSERVKLKLRAWKKMEEKRGGKLGGAKTVEYTKEGTAETLSDDLNQLLITDGFTGVNITGRGKMAIVHWDDHFTSFSGCVVDQASNRMIEARSLDDVKAYFTLDGAEYTNLIES